MIFGERDESMRLDEPAFRMQLCSIPGPRISEDKANRKMACEEAVERGNILWTLRENSTRIPMTDAASS
jgi:hypothetical protein